jgi:hypothetical protein
LKKGVGPQIQNNAARASKMMTALLVFKGPVYRTGKKPQLDRTGPGKDRKDRTSSPGLYILKIKDRKKTGLLGPVFRSKTGLNQL